MSPILEASPSTPNISFTTQWLSVAQVGEHAILRCRADYAYGEHGSPPSIPGGATLDFDVELLRSVLYSCKKPLGKRGGYLFRWHMA